MIIIISLLSFLIPAIILGITLYNYYSNKDIDWTPVEAKVLSVKLEEETHTRQTKSSPDYQRNVELVIEDLQISTGLTYKTYTPVICYEYTVNDQTYKPCINLDSSSSYSSAQSILNKYPVDKEFTVYYNPEDPINNRLTASVRFPWIIVIILSLIMIILPILIFFTIRLGDPSSRSYRPNRVIRIRV